jgi:hypothetical protein
VRRAASAFAVNGRRVDCLMSGNQPPGPPWKGLRQMGKTSDIREAVETEYRFDALVDLPARRW